MQSPGRHLGVQRHDRDGVEGCARPWGGTRACKAAGEGLQDAGTATGTWMGVQSPGRDGVRVCKALEGTQGCKATIKMLCRGV